MTVSVHPESPESVFAAFASQVWKYAYEGTLFVGRIAGGIPSDPNVAASWLRTKISDKDDIIREAVAKTMAERGISAEEANEEVASMRHFTGFKREPGRGLYIEGRQLKAAVKEAAMVAVAAGHIPLAGWGITRKYLKGFVAEHIIVPEERLYFTDESGAYITEPTAIAQQFVHTARGSAPHYKEYVDNARINFTLKTDWPFTDEQWQIIWLVGQEQGVGASRSGGFGAYKVIKWESKGEDASKAKKPGSKTASKSDTEEE